MWHWGEICRVLQNDCSWKLLYIKSLKCGPQKMCVCVMKEYARYVWVCVCCERVVQKHVSNIWGNPAIQQQPKLQFRHTLPNFHVHCQLHRLIYFRERYKRRCKISDNWLCSWNLGSSWGGGTSAPALAAMPTTHCCYCTIGPTSLCCHWSLKIHQTPSMTIFGLRTPGLFWVELGSLLLPPRSTSGSPGSYKHIPQLPPLSATKLGIPGAHIHMFFHPTPQ